MNAQKQDEAISYDLLKTLEKTPSLSQRDLACRLGISLGKVNYCLKALIDKGCVKVNSFRNSNNKKAYLYLLTPHGFDEKARITVEFLQTKMAEYEVLKKELDELAREVSIIRGGTDSQPLPLSSDQGEASWPDSYT